MATSRLLRSESAEGVCGPLSPPLDLHQSSVVSTPRELPFASVIKIFVISSKPTYTLPWQIGEQESCTGSGFVLDGKYILTNAHVVNNHTTVRVRRHGGSDKYPAQVVCVNRECDLALLTCVSEEFWKDLTFLSISQQLPELYENVMVIGYPMGGDNVCVTRGVVSRITTMSYAQPKFGLFDPPLMAIQIDAAINSGNSGGPVFRENGKVIGVAFCGYAGVADNIGYIIPKPVIDHFMDSFLRTGKANVICDMGLSFMFCENESLRAFHKIFPPLTGVLVTRVLPLGPAKQAGIQVDDVLLSVKGNVIANDGSCAFRKDERLSFLRHIGEHSGGPYEMEVLRGGERIAITLEPRKTPMLAPHRVPGKMPSYFIIGGLVFTTVTYEFLEATVENLSEDAWQPKTFEDQDLIILLSVMSHVINHGYYSTKLPLLASFNGEPVRNLRELKANVDKIESGYLQFKLKDGLSIVLDAANCRAVEDEILKTYAVPAPYSRDLAEDADDLSPTRTPQARTPQARTPLRSAKAALKTLKNGPSAVAEDASTPMTKRARLRAGRSANSPLRKQPRK